MSQNARNNQGNGATGAVTSSTITQTHGSGLTEKAIAQQRFDELSALLTTVVYLLSSMKKSDIASNTTSANVQHAITVSALLSTYLFCKYAANQFYLKYRNKVIFFARISYFILPMRSQNPRILRNLLERQPSSNLFDVWVHEPAAIGFGSQMVLLVVSAHMFALPMSLHLIAQAICIAGVVDLRSLCSTQLLSSDRYQKLILMACQSFESASKTVLIGPSLIPIDPEDRCCTIALVIYILFGFIIVTISLTRLVPPIVSLGAETNSFDRWLIRLFSHLARPNPELVRILQDFNRSKNPIPPDLGEEEGDERSNAVREDNQNDERMSRSTWWTLLAVVDTVRCMINWWLVLSTLWTLVALAQHNRVF